MHTHLYKRISLLLICSLLWQLLIGQNISWPKVAAASEAIRLQVNGKIVDLGRDPLLIDGRLLVPVRVFAEQFGAIVHWEPSNQSVTISNSERIVILIIDDNRANVAGQVIMLDVPATLNNGATYVPLRFIGEAIGVQVDYNSTENIVVASSVTKVTIGEIKDLGAGVELQITGQNRFSYKTMTLTNPERYVIDLQNTLLEQPEGEIEVHIAGIDTIRYAHHDESTPYTRIVIDFDGSAQSLDLNMTDDGRTLTLRSSFYFANSLVNRRVSNGEEVVLSFDGRIAPQMEAAYLSADGMTPVDLETLGSSLISGDRAPSRPASQVDEDGKDASTEDDDGIADNTASVEEEAYSAEESETVQEIKTIGREYIATSLDDLYFRTGPGRNYEPLGILLTGTTATLLQRYGDWAKLRLVDGTEGWSNTEYLEFGVRDITATSVQTVEPSLPATPTLGTLSTADSPGISSVDLDNGSTLEFPASVTELPEDIEPLGAIGYGVGEAFRIYLPGVMVRLPDGFNPDASTLIHKITMTAAPRGAWLNVWLTAKIPYQVSVSDYRLIIGLNTGLDTDTHLKSLQVSKSSSGSLVTVGLNRNADYNVEFLSNPERIEISVPNANLGNIPVQQLVRDGLIKQIRTNSVASNAKITIELEYMIGYRVLSDKPDEEIRIRFYTKGLAGKTIYLDPGHGGNPLIDNGDRGAVTKTNPIFYESTGTLDIGLKLKALLEEAGVTVLMTRSSDVAVSLRDRVDMINASDADVLVSIHHNSATNPSGHGLETYYWEQTVDRKQLAETLQRHLVEKLKLADRGVKRERFYPINYSTVPGVLVELAFLSNPVEELLIRDEIWRQRVASVLFEGLKEFFE